LNGAGRRLIVGNQMLPAPQIAREKQDEQHDQDDPDPTATISRPAIIGSTTAQEQQQQQED
jgi:hypothetical protein